MTNENEHLFTYLLVILISSFVKCLVKTSPHCINWVISFFLFIVIYHIYLYGSPLSDVFANIFSSFAVCLFTSLVVHFDKQTLLIFMKFLGEKKSLFLSHH